MSSMGNFINMMEELAVNECDPEAMEFLTWNPADCGCDDPDAVEDAEGIQERPTAEDTDGAHRPSQLITLDDLLARNTIVPVSNTVVVRRRCPESGRE
jgi:hypothetical protein